MKQKSWKLAPGWSAATVTNHINMAPPSAANWKTMPAGLLRDSSPSIHTPVSFIRIATSRLSATPKQPRFAGITSVISALLTFENKSETGAYLNRQPPEDENVPALFGHRLSLMTERANYVGSRLPRSLAAMVTNHIMWRHHSLPIGRFAGVIAPWLVTEQFFTDMNCKRNRKRYCQQRRNDRGSQTSLRSFPRCWLLKIKSETTTCLKRIIALTGTRSGKKINL